MQKFHAFRRRMLVKVFEDTSSVHQIKGLAQVRISVLMFNEVVVETMGLLNGSQPVTKDLGRPDGS